MPEHQTISLSGLRGWGQLAFDATEALTHVVEGMHHEIARRAPVLGTAQLEPTRGVTGLVYRSIRGTSRALATGDSDSSAGGRDGHHDADAVGT